MVNGKLEYLYKYRSCLEWQRIAPAEAGACSLIRAARDRDRRVRLGPGAVHVEAAIARLDIVAAEQAHPLDAAGGAAEHIVFWQREDDGRGAGDELEKRRFRLSAVGLGAMLDSVVSAGAREP